MASSIADRWHIKGRPAGVIVDPPPVVEPPIVEPPPGAPDPLEPAPTPFPDPFPHDLSEPDRRPMPLPWPTLPQRTDFGWEEVASWPQQRTTPHLEWASVVAVRR